ncbi:MAG: lipoprotein [Planctomycetes bacterium]|nr:lipoprotein [Planctomycetota bacterium]
MPRSILAALIVAVLSGCADREYTVVVWNEGWESIHVTVTYLDPDWFTFETDEENVSSHSLSVTSIYEPWAHVKVERLSDRGVWVDRYLEDTDFIDGRATLRVTP